MGTEHCRLLLAVVSNGSRLKSVRSIILSYIEKSNISLVKSRPCKKFLFQFLLFLTESFYLFICFYFIDIYSRTVNVNSVKLLFFSIDSTRIECVTVHIPTFLRLFPRAVKFSYRTLIPLGVIFLFRFASAILFYIKLRSNRRFLELSRNIENPEIL